MCVCVCVGGGGGAEIRWRGGMGRWREGGRVMLGWRWGWELLEGVVVGLGE